MWKAEALKALMSLWKWIGGLDLPFHQQPYRKLWNSLFLKQNQIHPVLLVCCRCIALQCGPCTHNLLALIPWSIQKGFAIKWKPLALNFEDISERSYTQKTTYGKAPFVANAQESKSTDRRWIPGYLGLELGRSYCKWAPRFPPEEKVLEMF